MPVKLSDREFREIVKVIIDSLPQEFLDKLDNVGIVVEDKPVSKKLIGLYQGVPYKYRKGYYSLVLPDKITIYKSNIESISKNIDELKENLRDVIIHELAHYFGISDRRLKELGLY